MFFNWMPPAESLLTMHLIDNLTDQLLQNDLNVVNSLRVIFSISKFPERDGDLRNYGNEALEVVKEYFGKDRSSVDRNMFPPFVNVHELSRDFAQFKLTTRGHDAGRMSFDDTCTIKKYPHLFPSFSRLAALSLMIPVSRVPCEKGF